MGLLQDRVAIVTGGAGNLGAHISRLCAAEGRSPLALRALTYVRFRAVIPYQVERSAQILLSVGGA